MRSIDKTKSACENCAKSDTCMCLIPCDDYVPALSSNFCGDKIIPRSPELIQVNLDQVCAR